MNNTKKPVYTTTQDRRKIKVFEPEVKECTVPKKGRYVPSEAYQKFKATLQTKREKSFLVEAVSSGILQNVSNISGGKATLIK